MVAPTVRTVLDIPALALVLRAGRAAIDAPVRWVAVSELEDPTPYLDGGELLLTTGLRLGDDDWTGFVDRLTRAGVSALGIGVGLTHDRVPPGLVAAAEAAVLPLLEVPEPTPFMAVSRAISDLLAAAEYEAVTRTVEAQRDLTRAALAPEGAAAVVARLSGVLGADLVLLDPVGRLLHAAPREAAGWVEAARAGGRADATARAAQLGGDRGGRTCTSSCSRWPRPVGCAASWPSPGSSRSPRPTSRWSTSASRWSRWRWSGPSGPTPRVASCARPCSRCSPTASRPSGCRSPASGGTSCSPDRCASWSPMGFRPTCWRSWSRSRSPIPPRAGAAPRSPTAGSSSCSRRLRRPTRRPRRPGTTTGAIAWGISDVVPVTAIGDGLRQGRRALAAAGAGGVRSFGDLARDGLVGLVDEEAARGFADALLGPLESRERGDLVASVRAWLAHHGQWDAAATTLGVHRHTLRYRMRRVEELLGRSLDDPDLRAELWVALAVRDRDATDTPDQLA